MSEQLWIAVVGASATVLVAVLPIIVQHFLRRPRAAGSRPYPWLTILAVGLSVVAIAVTLWSPVAAVQEASNILATGSTGDTVDDNYGDTFEIKEDGLLVVSASGYRTVPDSIESGWLEVAITVDNKGAIATGGTTISKVVRNTLRVNASAVKLLKAGPHRLDVKLLGGQANEPHAVNVEYYVLGVKRPGTAP